MPSLSDILREYEIDRLEMIAEQWGIDQEIDWRQKPYKQIAEKISDGKLLQEIISTIPTSALKTFQELSAHGGEMVRDLFTRSHGDLREMGAAIREKKRPDRDPRNDTELLYYRGVIALAFFERNGETKEYFFIPDEFTDLSLSHTQLSQTNNIRSLKRSPARSVVETSSIGILELIAFRLASLRGVIPETEFSNILSLETISFIDALLKEINIIDREGSIQTKKLANILLEDAKTLIPELFSRWKNSKKINDLRLLDTLTFEGQWVNNAIKPRKTILEIFRQLPSNYWFSIEDFVEWIYKHVPHYLRSGGEFDQWFIKEKGGGTFIKGFASWNMVDGALVYYFLHGPLNWFGLTRIGLTKKSDAQIVFMKTAHADGIIDEIENGISDEFAQEAIIHKNGDIFLPRNGNREQLYQFARFFTWIGKNEKFYQFRLSPVAIERARAQGMDPAQLKTIINKFGQKPIPTNTFSAIDRWQKNGSEIRIEDQVILRVKDNTILEQLATVINKKMVMEKLNKTTIIINRKDIRRFENIMQEMGYLVENLSKYNQ